MLGSADTQEAEQVDPIQSQPGQPGKVPGQPELHMETLSSTKEHNPSKYLNGNSPSEPQDTTPPLDPAPYTLCLGGHSLLWGTRD